MILSLDDLIARLETRNADDTKPGEALWIRLAPQKTQKTIEYRTASGNEIVHIYLDEQDALVGVEIFS